MHWEPLQAFLQTNWGWAAGLAASMVALTLLAGNLLNPARKDEIALWLMGEQTEKGWSQGFVQLFDAAFGKDHFSLRCFLRSTIASLVAVALIWLLMGNLGALGNRIRAELSLGSVLLIALAVNVVADYVSLLETRLVLGQIHRVRSALGQAAVLLADLAISGAIIWLAILAYVNSPLYAGDPLSFAETLGVFTVFSVLFYSTFLTSVWTWAYILTTWLMRVFRRLRLAFFLDVENKPIQVLAYVLCVVVFSGAMALAVPLRKDADGLSATDRALCTTFPGPVCLAVAELTPSQRAQLDLIMLACEWGMTDECFDRGLALYELQPEDAARFWQTACAQGDQESCTNTGHMFDWGRGVDQQYALAADHYRLGCEGGDARGCVELGYLLRHGLGVLPDSTAAAQMYSQGCDAGVSKGCTNLGALHESGDGVAQDLQMAAQLYRRGCDGGNARGCSNLGGLHWRGLGVDVDPTAAAELSRRGCDGGDPQGCTNLGVSYETGRCCRKAS